MIEYNIPEIEVKAILKLFYQDKVKSFREVQLLIHTFRQFRSTLSARLQYYSFQDSLEMLPEAVCPCSSQYGYTE